jgi:hypothetical protein
MKFLILYLSFSFLVIQLNAQNEHIYKKLSETYTVHQFPFTVKIPFSHSLMRFQDSIVIDIYYYQTYYDSKKYPTNRQDTTMILEYSFKQEGWYQIFVFSKQGIKLYQTSVLLLYKPKNSEKSNTIIQAKPIQFEWKGEGIIFLNDSTVIVPKKKRSYELDIYCTAPNILSDTLYINVYKTEKKGEEILFCQWKMVKQENSYHIRWTFKRKELDKYRLSVFDSKKYWYGSKETEIQESR